jgi:hypothetical protein
LEDKKIDWAEIEADYVSGSMTYAALAQQYGLAKKTVERHAGERGWFKKRQKHREKLSASLAKAEARKQVKRRGRYRAIEDKLLDKLEQAVDELDLVIKTKVTKIKTVKYENEKRPDKPTEEVTVEEQEHDAVKVMIDRSGLAAVTNALEKLKAAQGLRSELDEEEQRARIAALNAKVAESEREQDGMEKTVKIDFVPLSEIDYGG